MKKLAIVVSVFAFINCSNTQVVKLDRPALVPALDSLGGHRVAILLRGDSVISSRTILHAKTDSIQFVGSDDTSSEWFSLDKIQWVDVTKIVNHGLGFLDGVGIGILTGGVVFTGLCAVSENENNIYYIQPIGCGVLAAIPTGLVGGIIGGIAGHRYITRYPIDSTTTVTSTVPPAQP